MAAHLLICHHHRQALRNACERGFWMPLALPAAVAEQVSHLTGSHSSLREITTIAPITEMVLFSQSDGISHYLPFVGRQLPLAHPLTVVSHHVVQASSSLSRC